MFYNDGKVVRVSHVYCLYYDSPERRRRRQTAITVTFWFTFNSSYHQSSNGKTETLLLYLNVN